MKASLRRLAKTNERVQARKADTDTTPDKFSPSGPKKSDSQPVLRVEGEPLPSHAARDLNSAMDYFEKNYLTSIAKMQISEALPDGLSKQVDLLISASMRMEAPNFSFFDKCPRAVFYFISTYLGTLEEPLFTEQQVEKIFVLNSSDTPMQRLLGYQNVVHTSRNKELIKHLLLFLFGVHDRSQNREDALNSLVDIFAEYIFKHSGTGKRRKKMQRASTEFAIQRAEHLFPNQKKDEVSILYQSVERRLGTDGMLFLYEKELLSIADELDSLDYAGVISTFDKIESELASMNSATQKLAQRQETFESRVTARLGEIKQSLDACEPQYNHWDLTGPEVHSDSEEDEF